MSEPGIAVGRSPTKVAAHGSERPLSQIALLIPAWEPSALLTALAADLVARGFDTLLIVDDGSSAATRPIFDKIAVMPGIELLRHAVNLGKGRALKTGFNHLLTTKARYIGVVTADADGQHTADDIERVAQALLENISRPVLGSRDFGRDVPLRSRLGNVLTRRVFGFLTGTRLTDTQTGLRGLPTELLPELLALDGERYEYEMTVLAHLCRSGQIPIELPITTIYIETNRGSHFNPVWDSMRIYFVLLRFYASSLLAAGVDLAVFSLCFALSHKLLLSVIVGRLSSLINYAVNRRFVFHNHAPVPGSLRRYYLLAVIVAAVSYSLILVLTTYAHWNIFLAKISVDILLSLVSFSAQRTFVFRRGEAL